MQFKQATANSKVLIFPANYFTDINQQNALTQTKIKQ